MEESMRRKLLRLWINLVNCWSKWMYLLNTSSW